MSARVFVVGGGPAGLATATVLARRGVPVTLAEAYVWPRHKMCGEFLSPDAERALAEIGAGDVIRSLDAPSIDALRVTVGSEGRVVAEAVQALEVPGHGVSRIDLDAALAATARAAGVDVREHTRVERFASDAAGVRAAISGWRRVAEDDFAKTAEEIAADAVVVATGRVPGLGRPERAGSRFWMAVKTHVRGLRLPGVTELHFIDGAYVGLNEVSCRGERVVNVCAVSSSRTWDRARMSASHLWTMFASENPAFAERWRQADPVNMSFVAAAGFEFDIRDACGRGERPAFFVGDAAALIAPLCGDGQAMALAGGAALGRILADAGSLSDPAVVGAAAAAWDGEFRSSFRGRLLLGRALQAVMLRPAAAKWIVRSAALSGTLTNWLYRGTRGPLDEPPTRSASVFTSDSTSTR